MNRIDFSLIPEDILLSFRSAECLVIGVLGLFGGVIAGGILEFRVGLEIGLSVAIAGLADAAYYGLKEGLDRY